MSFEELVTGLVIKPERAQRARAWFSRGLILRKSCSLTGMDSYMAGPIWVKLSGIEEGHSVHVLGQEKFCQAGQDQVGEQQVPLLGHGVDQETCNLVSVHNWP